MPEAPPDPLRLVVDSIPALISYVDTNRRYRLVNAAYEQWFGHPRSQIEGREVREILGDEAYAAVAPYVERALAGEVVGYETYAAYRHGGHRHIRATYAPDHGPDGRVRGFVALVEDISPTRRAEEELASVRLQMSRILASVTDGVCTFDREWRYTYLNPQAERYLGRPASELLGRVLWEVFPQAGGAAGAGELRRVMTERMPQHYESFSPIASRWVEADAYPFDDGVSVFFRDVTERKEAERALRESEERLRLAYTAAGLVVWDLEPMTGTMVCTPNAAALFGMERGPMAALFAAVHPEDRPAVQAVTDACLRGERDEYRAEFRVTGPDGITRWVVSRGETRRDAAGQVIRLTGAVVDVTDRKQAEERLRQSAKMEAIGRLAGGLAHDFNNQLHALSGFAEFVARDTGLGPRARRDLLEIQGIADRMAGLTRQLLAFSRQQVLAPETLDLNAAVVEGQALLQRLIGRNIEIDVHLAAGPAWVRVDRAQLLQVLMNLVINARDAMSGGGSLAIRTLVRAVAANELDDAGGDAIPPGRYVVLAVSDSGAGIAPENLPNIFEPFFTTKGVGHGTGLGLATVHGIVTQSRGHVRVESRPGRGTTFEIFLPLSDAPDPVAGDGGRAPESGAAAGRVLVVDDEDIVRTVLARMLEAEGFQVLQARHGAEALNRLEQSNGQVDLVVSDIVMPVMDGRELAERMATAFPGVPVVWISGYPRDAAVGLDTAMERAFLQKPVRQDLLVHAVRRALAARRASDNSGG